MRMGNTMPLTKPKAARGSSTMVFRDRRLGTIRFSVVLMPDFSTSAAARGTAVCTSRRRTEIRSPAAGFSRSRKNTRQLSVIQAPAQLPRMMLWQALAASVPAQKISAVIVTAMEQSCSATSTAARVPIRFAAVK